MGKQEGCGGGGDSVTLEKGKKEKILFDEYLVMKKGIERKN